VVFGLMLVAFALSRLFWLSMLLAPVIGFCLILFFAAANTQLQLRSPDGLRGRVMSLYAITLVGMAPFGSLLAGTMANSLGAPWTIGLTGALTAIGLGVVSFSHPAAPSTGGPQAG
jgi:hypothetical protein